MAAACIIGRAACVVAELDAATLEGCRARDPAALRRFVECYEGRVFAFLSRMVGAGPHVEDLAQEVFIRGCRALSEFGGAGTARLSTWLLTIARRIAIDARRKRHLSPGTFAGEPACAPATPETERRRMEIGRALERAAAALSEEHRVSRP